MNLRFTEATTQECDMQTNQENRTWPELAIGLYDQLTSRGAEITYEFDKVCVGVPRTADPEAPKADWRIDGTLKIRTRDLPSS